MAESESDSGGGWGWLSAIVAAIVAIFNWLFGSDDKETKNVDETGVITGAWNSLSDSAKLAVVGTAAYMVAPEATTKALDKTGEAAGGLLGATISGTGSFITSLFKSPWAWIAAGIGLWWLLRDEDEATVVQVETPEESEPEEADSEPRPAARQRVSDNLPRKGARV